MVVIAHLPETPVSGLAEIMSRSQFEIADEFTQIRGRLSALSKGVEMIGHQAVRVKKEGMPRCTCEELAKNPM